MGNADLNTDSSQFKPIWAAGFMSGTSLDAVDVAMILTDGEKVLEFGPVAERKYRPGERAVLQKATDEARAWNWQGIAPVRAFAAAEQVIHHTHLDAWQMLLADWDGPAPEIVGVHGQTVLHRRPVSSQKGATLQLLKAERLQQALGVPLVYDFRTEDVEAGGEGAPLAPAYHGALLDRLGDGDAAVLNLGGVANITGRSKDGTLWAFDTGPANGPIDEWIERHARGTYDQEGAIARSGHVDPLRLEAMLKHPYFSEPAPKSLDRFDFNAGMVEGLSLEDGAATLTAFSAHAVAKGVALLPEMIRTIVACGGGRHNPVLMKDLNEANQGVVISAEEAGWRGDSIEAEAFAFLAVRRRRELPISWPTTTGVPQPMTGGRLIGI